MADPNTPLHGIPSQPLHSGSPAGSATEESRSAQRHPTRFELWLHRASVLMFVFLCASSGVLLVIMPWRPEWTDNHFLLAYPWLRAFIANGFVRGVCSGLGILDIWI